MAVERLNGAGAQVERYSSKSCCAVWTKSIAPFKTQLGQTQTVTGFMLKTPFKVWLKVWLEGKSIMAQPALATRKQQRGID